MRPRKPQQSNQPDRVVDELYGKAGKQCDFVVKGSLASAIVHASAACELGKTYRFRSIGGSGAASVSAAMIAAAETGRHRKEAGFKELSKVLNALGEKGSNGAIALFDLVVPDGKTQKYFGILKDSFAGLKPHEMNLPVLSALKNFPGFLFLMAMPGLALAATAFFAGPLWLKILWFLAGLLVAGLLPTVVVRQRILKQMNLLLTENSYGFCSGMEKTGKKEALGDWLNNRLNSLAGKAGPEPLLFEDLKWLDLDEERPVDLQLQATDISINTPVRFANSEIDYYQADQVYYFKPQELKKYLPESVVETMIKHSRKQRHFKRLKGYFALPPEAKMPVAFAVRCSMSVPLLFSAIPLYRAVRLGGRGQARWEPRRSWIVGGELSGTFDVDAFDSPLPHHPTFAIHVSPIGSDDESREEQLKGIWVQNLITHSGPTLWREFNDIRGYARACVYTAQNWHEGVLLETPGYRERIAVAKISQQQTGLFPAIDAKAYNHLMSLGQSIGANLVNRFAEKPTRKLAVSWEAHRWIRFRRQMAQLEQQLISFRGSFHRVFEDDQPYEAMLMRGRDEPPHAFHWKDIGQRNHALRITTKLLKLIESWEESPSSFIDKRAPYSEDDQYNEQLR